MIFLKNMKRIFSFLIIIALAVFVMVSLAKCGKNEYPNPSKEYYINDFAKALLPGTRELIFENGEQLYLDTKDTEEGGAQVVVATFEVENENSATEIDATELYRQWKIGENDMGALILLIFMPKEDEEGEYLELVSAQIEIGYRMEQYVTAMRAGQIIDGCLYNEEWNGSIDMGLGEMYFELMKTIYVDAYGYDSYTYDMNSYREYIFEASDFGADVSMDFLYFLLSPYSSLFTKLTVIAFFLLGGGILFAARKGGGGRSGGYGAKR